MAAGTDVAYWEGLAAELKTYRARISLQDAHKDLLERIERAKEEKDRICSWQLWLANCHKVTIPSKLIEAKNYESTKSLTKKKRKTSSDQRRLSTRSRSPWKKIQSQISQKLFSKIGQFKKSRRKRGPSRKSRIAWSCTMINVTRHHWSTNHRQKLGTRRFFEAEHSYKLSHMNTIL